MFGLIYKITNIQNKKIYFGQTTLGLETRQKIHFKDANRKSITPMVVDRAIRKYGKHNFKWDIIGYCNDRNELDYAEEACIELFQSFNKLYGYNVARTSHGCSGYQHTNKAKLKISKSSQEHWKDQSYREKLIPQIKERFLKNHKEILAKSQTFEARKKRGDALRGKPLSIETKNKMKLARQRIGHTGGRIKKEIDMQKLFKMRNNGSTIYELSLFFNLSCSSIRNRLKENIQKSNIFLTEENQQ